MVTRGKNIVNQFAFYAFRPTIDGQGYIGAILVTDERGIPLEFRCTHPVRPSAVQKALYGKNLESYVSLDLCGQPLLEALSSSPVVCLVESRELVALREFVSLPVMFLQKRGDILEASDQHSILSESKEISTYGNGIEPLSAYCHHQWESDFDETVVALEQVSTYIDLLEPFQRITTSLSILADRDERYK